MDDWQIAARVLTAALERLRLLSQHPHLSSSARRHEIFVLADLVHNAPEWLLDRDGESPLVMLRSYAKDPLAARWLETELADIAAWSAITQRQDT